MLVYVMCMYMLICAYMCLCNVYASMQYLKINTYKQCLTLTKAYIYFYARLLVWQTMLNKQNNIKQLVTHTKQSINIHAKAYKVIAMQYKA